MDASQLETASRTVIDIADHMRQLRAMADAFRESFATGTRGFFSPSEDDQVVALWVSYHKSRNALLEVISTIRNQVTAPSDREYAEFVIAYGAAVVLVDAARFLRESFADDAIVRRKLNEENVPYGIPAASFDAVQLSLTDPSNAMQINQGNKFYVRHRDGIGQLVVGDSQLESILQIIDSLADRVQVSTTRYVSVRTIDRRRQLNDVIVQDGLLRSIYTIQEWGSRFVSSLSTRPGYTPRMPDAIVGPITQMLRPGDVFVTRKDAAVTNYFLPGFWPHAAMYVGDGHVIESLKDGVRHRTLDSPFGNDATIVLRPDISDTDASKAIERARTHIGKPYDFDFDFTRADRMVCTEVVYRSYEGIGGIQFQLTRRAGRETLSAEDLLGMALNGDGFLIVAGYCAKFSDELLTGSDVEEVLRQTLATK